MELSTVWKDYNEVSCQLSSELGRSNNLVGEYAEYLANTYIKGTLANLSNKSVDIEKNGKRYQVKSRRIENGTTTQLGVIRSWDFDYLVVIIFSTLGIVKSARITPAAVAREIAVHNNHQNGYVITTNYNFFNCRKFTDVTLEMKIGNGEDVEESCQILELKTRTFTKVHKIQQWARHPEQINHRIIRAYLKLSHTKDVKKSELTKMCSDNDLAPEFFIEKFNQNFNSMKTDAGNSHGKIFFEDNGYVYVFPQALAEINRWFKESENT